MSYGTEEVIGFITSLLQDYQEELHTVEKERIAILQVRRHSEQHTSEFMKLKSQVQARQQQLKKVRPILAKYEKIYKKTLLEVVSSPKVPT